jgi:hypothetical protein
MSTTICPGNGTCLEQNSLDSYSKSELISCSYNCKILPCPNFTVCGNSYPEWLLRCHRGLCQNCNMLFKYLVFTENEEECPICFEKKLHVKQLNCNHKICVDCFKRCYIPPYWNDPQPDFPYSSDVEDEYDSYHEDPRWKRYPLIKKYEEDTKKWYEERGRREDSEKYLKHCSQCRK